MATIGEEIKRLQSQYSANLEEHVAVVVWSEDDVIGRARERGITLTRQEAQGIIDAIHRRHSATLGITWDTIDCWLDNEAHILPVKLIPVK